MVRFIIPRPPLAPVSEKAYRVERAARPDDGVPAAYAGIIGELRVGEVVTTTSLCAMLGDSMSVSAGKAAKMAKLRKAMVVARSAGIVVDVTRREATPYKDFLELPAVAHWIRQLNPPNRIHGKGDARGGGGGTRGIYGHALYRFSSWLRGKKWPLSASPKNGGAGGDRRVNIEIRDVGHMLELALERGGVDRDLSVIVRQFFAEQNAEKKYSASSMSQMRSAVKSFFMAHEIPYALQLPRYMMRGSGGGAGGDEWEDRVLKMSEFARMLTVGKPTVRDRAILLAKFHRGLDLSTLTDRFNYTAFDQIVKHMGTDDHLAWDLDKCPVPVTLVRVKTNVKHVGFLERDAMSANIEWITERERLTGRPLRRGDGQALYLTQRGDPIGNAWVSSRFRTLAVRAGLHEKTGGGNPPATRNSHQLRHLLKSTLIDAGCRIDIADHVIGHSPKDTYEKQAVLYPESLRSEYAKASAKINIFSNFESSIDASDDIHRLRAEVKADRAKLREVLAAVAAEREREAAAAAAAAAAASASAKACPEAAGAPGGNGLAPPIADMLAALVEDVRMLKEERELAGIGGGGGIGGYGHGNGGNGGGGGREYQCIACQLVHTSNACPACGSPERRMYGHGIVRGVPGR